METHKTKLFTRKEVIEIWQDQKEEFLNSYCCPNCRDLLFDHPYQIMFEKSEKHLYCHNAECSSYNLPIENIK